MIDKTFDPAAVEPRIRAAWDAAEAFRAGLRPAAEPYCIVIPPPNVTGSLHMGHALNNTLQDILVRYQRMRGRDVLWQVGTDHAGIATQMVVERQLMERQEPGRREMGRAAFLERVWQWKAESGGTIINQLRRLGASCDWSRERFTMDEGLSRAVVKVFVDLHEQGLIYKDKRLVNWDPKLLTAISDLEVEAVEVRGSLWHFDYPLADGLTYRHPVAWNEADEPVEWEERSAITVATTRPETMLGDTAVAVHPEDPRYKDLIGRSVRLPLVGRLIPIVGDAYADPAQGSGAVKITPAHDFNDFEVGRRHGLPMISILSREARTDLAGNAAFLEAAGPEAAEAVRVLHDLDRFEARERVIAMMRERGLLRAVEDHTHMVPHGDRSGTVIEPYLTDQWYVDAKTLAEPALRAVEEGRTVFVPKAWEKTYFEWMRNIQPWCISRQLWWGHQIPAWYAEDGSVFVAHDEAQAREKARAAFGREVALTRDEDVLDTWFSSALWPFSTLGWPDETVELKRYYPTDVLVTGFDIIFFWVARMMMMGLHVMKEVPFPAVYIHALVRDEKGAKMSKSKGNVIDPLELIDAYGADALRFTLAAMAAQGRDIKLSRARIEGYRNFGTKLWNASRFAQMNECVRVPEFDPSTAQLTVNRWILSELARCSARVGAAIEEYRFNEAASALYQFTWHVFCDWYLELVKPVLAGREGPEKAETRAVAAVVLDGVVALLHPFMPFLTEELWARLADHGPPREGLLALAPWPALGEALIDTDAEAELGFVVKAVSEIRSVRAEMNVPPAARLPLLVRGADDTLLRRLRRHEETILSLARLERITMLAADDTPERGAAELILEGASLFLPLAGFVDLEAETARLRKELGKAEQEIGRIEKKLANPQFLEKAPEEVIEENRERAAEEAARAEKLRAALGRLGS
ncbi:MAG: valine--tRNA ligase [Alphaproteobacteria bacterium]|nr:valine--tRNA ligase [Alphaproteobacteria bacterium]